jgi:hypothetical protein
VLRLSDNRSVADNLKEIPIYARVDQTMKNALAAEAKERGESESLIIREALREHFARREKLQAAAKARKPHPK